MIPDSSALDKATEVFLESRGKISIDAIRDLIAKRTSLTDEDATHALGIAMVNVRNAEEQIRKAYLDPDFSKDVAKEAFVSSAALISPDISRRTFDHAFAWVTR